MGRKVLGPAEATEALDRRIRQLAAALDLSFGEGEVVH